MPETKDETKFQRTDYVLPIILIGSGIMQLLNNFGIIGWEVWNIIYNFWPVILILIGLEHLFSGSFPGIILILFISLIVITTIFLYSFNTLRKNPQNWQKRDFDLWEQILNNFQENNIEDIENRIFNCNPLTEDCHLYFK